MERHFGLGRLGALSDRYGRKPVPVAGEANR